MSVYGCAGWKTCGRSAMAVSSASTTTPTYCRHLAVECPRSLTTPREPDGAPRIPRTVADRPQAGTRPRRLCLPTQTARLQATSHPSRPHHRPRTRRRAAEPRQLPRLMPFLQRRQRQPRQPTQRQTQTTKALTPMVTKPERTAEDWVNWFYDQPITERRKGRLRMTSEEFNDLHAFADLNGLPWPKQGLPILLGCEIWCD